MRKSFEKKERFMRLTPLKWSWCKSWYKRYHVVCTISHPKYTKKALPSENNISSLKGQFLLVNESSVCLLFRISNKKLYGRSHIRIKRIPTTDWQESQEQPHDTFFRPSVIIAQFVTGLAENPGVGVNGD